ncbi:MAG: DAK2 domain-containing protein [Clostridiales bacterium]|nr:DAK2 domain-containing protein [Clostridiales bacterium]
MQKVINGAMLKSMILTAAKLLEVNKATIDALNVFPVPDGDTGTNMTLTFQSAIKELVSCKSNKISDIAEAVSKGALRGARGNSGVILSQVLRGFCNTLKKAEEIDTKLFSQALVSGAQIAYGAVSKPKEGTMLTVARMVAEHSQTIKNKHKDFETFLPEIIKAGNEAVELTPSLLPVLKKAGVVDAGGKGLMCLYEGMYKALMGESVSEDVVAPVTSSESDGLMDHADIMNLGNIEFAYCTEFFIINLHKKTTLADIERLKESLMRIGDSVIVIGDLEFVKVHVHTNQPGKALTRALELGELDRLKIENMLEQNRALMKKYEAEKKEMGMLAISAGDGISGIFKDLTVDAVIEGGQSMNPSADDIASAAQRINADNIFVFPNNKNIILAAEQAKSLVQNKRIHVIPTKNIPQGFSAALAFNPELSVDENKANMIHALDTVTVGQVTYSVRDTKLYGFDLKVGDIMGLDSKKILAKGQDVAKVALNLIEKLRNGEEIITLYYGQDVKEEDAVALQQTIMEKYPDCDVDIHYGGQPIYYYYIALE